MSFMIGKAVMSIGDCYRSCPAGPEELKISWASIHALAHTRCHSQRDANEYAKKYWEISEITDATASYFGNHTCGWSCGSQNEGTP